MLITKIFNLIEEIKKTKIEIVDIPNNTDYLETNIKKSKTCINGKCDSKNKQKIKIGV